jgi:hypothetical protein
VRITLCVSTLLRSTGYTDAASRKFWQYFCGGIVLGNLLENKAFRGFSLRRQLFDELAVLHPSGGCTVTHHRHAILAPCLSI